MSALLKNEVFATTVEYAPVTTKAPSWTPRVINGTPAPVATPRANPLKNVALFLAAPFIGLAYILSMPLVGFGMLTWFAGKAAAAKYPMVKAVTAIVAAPFVGLAFILTMPLFGLATLVWVGTHRNANS